MDRRESSSGSCSEPEGGIVQIDKTYAINVEKELGKGGFGSLFIGENINTHQKVAVKVEKATTRSHLQMEAKIMLEIQGGRGIPKVYKFIKKKEENYLVMELLGKSIDKLFSQCKKTFSIKTVMLIALQMIDRIEYVHSKGYIHRDIKPGNFLIGTGENKSLIYIIDFGLSKAYINKETGEHIPYKEGKGLTVNLIYLIFIIQGTARYTSLFTHLGIEQSRRDDIEGIAYNLIYLARGSLPWQGVKAKTKKEKHQKIMDQKTAITPEELCKGLPNEILSLLIYARVVGFDEKPCYKDIKSMFTNYMEKNNIPIDNIFDWDLLDGSSTSDKHDINNIKKVNNK